MKKLLIGIGGCGLGILEIINNESLLDIDLLGIDTEKAAISNCCERNNIKSLQIGEITARGLNTFRDLSLAERAVLESEKAIERELVGFRQVILVCGMGGGMAGGACVIAKKTMDMGIKTVGIITMPFGFEEKNKKIYENAQICKEKLLEYCRYIEMIMNEYFIRTAERGFKFPDVLREANKMIVNKTIEICQRKE